jgi:hypothetical protein
MKKKKTTVYRGCLIPETVYRSPAPTEKEKQHACDMQVKRDKERYEFRQNTPEVRKLAKILEKASAAAEKSAQIRQHKTFHEKMTQAKAEALVGAAAERIQERNLDQVIAQRNELLAQRNELLAACKDVVMIHGRDLSSPNKEVIVQLRAAIARAERKE